MLELGKLDAPRVQTGQSLSEYQGFGRELICYTGTLFFLTYYNSRLFQRSVRTIQSDVINFQHFLTSFAIFQSFTDLFRELNDREIENHYTMNSENVETWHGIIISPTQHVQESREGYGKNWTHLVYKLNSSLFLRSVCIIQSDVINFQHVLTSFAFFSVIYRFVQRAK